MQNLFFILNHAPTTDIYTLSLHDALPISARAGGEDDHRRGRAGGARRLRRAGCRYGGQDRKSTRLNSSHVRISYAVFCLKKKNKRDMDTYGLFSNLTHAFLPISG